MKNPIEEYLLDEDGQTVDHVSALRLYKLLGKNISGWSTWAKKTIVENPELQEGIDWYPCNMELLPKAFTPNPTQDYYISFRLAVSIAMRSNTSIGKQVRLYYITITENFYFGEKFTDVEERDLHIL